jgi:hypothetical protein
VSGIAARLCQVAWIQLGEERTILRGNQVQYIRDIIIFSIDEFFNMYTALRTWLGLVFSLLSHDCGGWGRFVQFSMNPYRAHVLYLERCHMPWFGLEQNRGGGGGVTPDLILDR